MPISEMLEPWLNFWLFLLSFIHGDLFSWDFDSFFLWAHIQLILIFRETESYNKIITSRKGLCLFLLGL